MQQHYEKLTHDNFIVFLGSCFFVFFFFLYEIMSLRMIWHKTSALPTGRRFSKTENILLAVVRLRDMTSSRITLSPQGDMYRISISIYPS